jgi:AAA domain
VPRTDARRQAQVAELQKELATVYTPSHPIDDPRLFSGRSTLLADLRLALPTRAAFVLYGERGAGKTSLWQVVLHDQRVERHQASTTDDFVSIFFRVLEHLGEQFTENERTNLTEVTGSIGVGGASAGASTSEEARLEAVAKRALDLNFVLDRVEGKASSLDAIVIDEFQNISTQAVQAQIIEVVKAFADRRIPVKIFLVGVADSDDELIPNEEYQREYKERHFFVRRVPLMSDDEARNIFEVRKSLYNVAFDAQVKDSIVGISGGYPSTTHSLALSASQAWATRAFVGSLFSLALSFVPIISSLSSVVKKAGVHVEQQDLRIAVMRFAQEFHDNHQAVSDCYKALALAGGEPIDRVLSAFTSSPTRSLSIAQLAETSGVPRPDVEVLLETQAQGLVERVDHNVRLVAPGLRSFIQATRYLAT